MSNDCKDNLIVIRIRRTGPDEYAYNDDDDDVGGVSHEWCQR